MITYKHTQIIKKINIFSKLSLYISCILLKVSLNFLIIHHIICRKEGGYIMTKDMKNLRIKSHVYDGTMRSPNRAMLRAVGLTDEDFEKPMVGIADTESDVTP